jgi:ubiquinone/menaquinone biosynthesis C-methylase UbiE
MQIEEAIKLIRHPALPITSRMDWADLGCGSGLFTHALAHLLGPASKIYAIDKDLHGFGRIVGNINVRIEKVEANFITDTLNLQNLDGILMANSLHFVSDKPAFFKKWNTFFKQQERYLIVEYDTDIPNRWVPYPISFYSLQRLFAGLDFEFIKKIHEIPSRYNHGNIYSVLVMR